jgi:hypothetical protein
MCCNLQCNSTMTTDKSQTPQTFSSSSSSSSSLFNASFSATQDYIASISNQSWFVCHLAAKQVKCRGEPWLNFADEYLSCSQGSLTCRKSTTWYRPLYFPSEGRRATDFITLKIHRPRPGLNPRTLGPVASTLTTRPPRATQTFRRPEHLWPDCATFWHAWWQCRLHCWN